MVTVKQNQLVFRGTRKEVDNAESIDRCWYLAWDTGELFVGNNLGTKTRYGGSNSTLSETDIKKLIENHFSSYKDQFSEHNKIITEVSSNLEIVKNSISETKEYLQEEIDKALNDIGSFDSIIVTESELQNTLSEYISKDNAASEFIVPKSGNEIISSLHKDGFYYCISDFANNDYTLYKGNIYQIENETIIELGGGFGGSSSGELSINHFSIFDYSEKSGRVYKSSPIDGKIIPAYFNISNASLANSIKIFYNNQDSNEIIEKKSGSQSIELRNTSQFLNYHEYETKGKNTFILSIETLYGKIEKTFIYYICRPIYYGFNTISEPSESLFSSLTEKDGVISAVGKYTTTASENASYLWFCVPSIEGDAMEVDIEFKSNGFNIPMLEMNVPNVNYNFYRSVESLEQGQITFVVENN